MLKNRAAKNLLIKKEIRRQAFKTGFDLIGFSNVKPDYQSVKAFNTWLANKYHGTMHYMEKSSPRRNPAEILPEAKTVISLAVNYYREQPTLKAGEARVARYAYGRDYHKIIGKWLRELQNFIQQLCPDSQSKAYVDTGPVLERSFAEQSGLGVIGKNACLITSEFGSWVFLAGIVTTLQLPPDKNSPDNHHKTPATQTCNSQPSPQPSRQLPPRNPSPLLKGDKPFSVCGGCRRCIDACPTGAIIAPGVIDSRKCISYLTIELKDNIPPKLAAKIRTAQLLYGCDICQEVCPHNQKRQRINTHPQFSKPIAGDALKPAEILKIHDDMQFLSRFAGSPLMRAKRKGLQKSARAIVYKKFKGPN